ncbi:MAG: glutamine-hydrolyzing carbamoyl-phosphate synthase small subunit [Gammaproteobacteria bacterium]
MTEDALLVLADGTRFVGKNLGATGTVSGEVIFNTAQSGYQEILTDPSYHSQLITFTFPHIGNTGINQDDMEGALDSSMHCAGVIVRHLSQKSSNWRSEQEMEHFLRINDRVGIQGIDTRQLTIHIRQAGALNGCILSGIRLDTESDFKRNTAKALEIARQTSSMSGLALAPMVSLKEPLDWPASEAQDSNRHSIPLRIALYDFGCKRNILQLLHRQGAQIRIFPYHTSPQEIADWKPSGVVLTNGPGDPAACVEAIENTRDLLKRNIPILGICLGHQILALALGARTQKMKFGHHGANHPVLELKSGKVFISSQNHGFAIDDSGLPAELVITHRSLFDDSIQGFKHPDLLAVGFQGHPEASPGPRELEVLIRQWVHATQTKESAHAS